MAQATKKIAEKTAWLREAIERGKKECFSIVADITPEAAALLLDNNPDNRSINATIVRQLVADMKNKRWQFNGESIIVADTGELNDGQHRLSAAVEAGFTFKSVLVFGVPRVSRITLDMGRIRSVGDYLQISSIKNSMTVAAITRLVMSWERANGRNFEAGKWLTIPEQITRAMTDEAIHHAANWAVSRNPYAHRLAPGSAFGFCYVVLSRINPSDAETYLEQVVMGEGLHRKDAAFAVRDALVVSETRIRVERIAMILRGWSHFRNQTEPSKQAINGRFPLPELN
jgi:hypothetical protein